MMLHPSPTEFNDIIDITDLMYSTQQINMHVKKISSAYERELTSK